MMFQIEIPKRATHCAKGGEPLLHGTEYYSILSRQENGESYQRKDFCPSCWEKGGHSKEISSWKSVVPQKKEALELPKHKDERALFLLKEALANPESSENTAEAFVLALYLARKRLIVLRQEMLREEKVPICIYEVIETEEMLCVPKISVSNLRVEEVQAELSKKFNAK